MKIKVLGTGASEGIPSLFCNCELCRKVRKIKGKDVRSRTSVLIDENYLIDFNSDNFLHWTENDIDFTRLKDIFITHNHEDHFLYTELRMLSEWFSCSFRNERVTLHGNHDVILKVLERPLYKYNKLYLHETCPFDIIKLDDGHIFTAVKAEHRENVQNDLNYIVEFKGKSFIYLCDTGVYKDNQTWDFLKNYKFDAVISECTFGDYGRVSPGHQHFEDVLRFKEKFLSLGCIREDTPYYLTHFSHNIGLLHNELCEKTRQWGLKICYDGMDIMI